MHRVAVRAGALITCLLTLATPLVVTRAEAAATCTVAQCSAIPAPAPATTSVVLDGVRVQINASTKQAITVRRTGSTQARLTLWRRSGDQWIVRVRTTNGHIGYGGLVIGVARRQGSGTTPIGTYALPFAFGVKPTPGGALPYHHVAPADWWVEDNNSPYYNRLHAGTKGFAWRLNPNAVNGSEHLIRYRPQYNYAIVIAYNYYHPVHYRGAGLFLHVNGSGATAGCVSGPEWFIRAMIRRLQPASHPVIAIGR